MPYLKAVVAAVLTALAIGAATGGVEVVRRAFASLPPADAAPPACKQAK